MKIETARTIIRSVTTQDLDDLFEILSNADVTRYLPFHSHTNKEYTYNVMKQGFLVRPEEAFVILDKNSNRVIGTFDNTPNEDNTMIEISYALLPSFQRKGIMSEVLENMTIYIIHRYISANIITADVLIENEPSIKFLENNGFVRISDSQVTLHNKPELSGNFWHYEKSLSMQ
jgi:ribosomal-protein-alanine N-acetyltransferase